MNIKLTFPAILAAIFLSVSAHGQQKIKTIAGTGIGDFGGDGFAAGAARLHSPQDLKLDGNGNLYILDYLNVRIRKINTSGIIVTAAGSGIIGNSGDGSISTSANMRPTGIALDKSNNLYIADGHHAVIRKVNSLGIISTIAGTNSVYGNTGYGGPAGSALLGFMHGIAFDNADNLYITDSRYHHVRKITPGGIIERFAGNDTAGYMGDDGPATTARLDSPYAIVADRWGNVYVSDLKYNVVRRIDASGIITTYAGDGTQGYTGDGGLAGAAKLDRPAGLAVDTSGNLYIADADNNVVRKVDATTGIITTVVGNGTPGFGGDLGYVNGCNLRTPFGLAVAENGDIYIADANNQRIRQTYSPVSVSTVNNQNVISLFPNPADETCFVSNLNSGDVVTVLDATGRTMASYVAKTNHLEMDLNTFTPGIYLVRVVDASGNSLSAARLVKQ